MKFIENLATEELLRRQETIEIDLDYYKRNTELAEIYLQEILAELDGRKES